MIFDMSRGEHVNALPRLPSRGGHQRAPRGRLGPCVCCTGRREGWRRERRSLRHPPVLVVHVRNGPDGCTLEVLHRPVARQPGCFVFVGYPRPLAGTRVVKLRGVEFYAFTAPHEDTIQVAVWRQLGDVVDAGYRQPGDSSPFNVQQVCTGDSLSPGRIGARVGPLADLYQRKEFDRRAWVYWESFWVPTTLAGAKASAAKPLFNLATVAPAGAEAQRNGPDPAQAAKTEDTGTALSKAEAFSEIYRRNVWPGLLSRSGPGSDPFHPMVRIAVTAIDMALDLLAARSLLDAACGDAAWMVAAVLSRRSVQYTGVDIVQHVIEENQRSFPSHRFLAADCSSNAELPQADVVFSKETLNHMFVEDAVQALKCFRRSSRYLVTNIHRGAPNNLGASKGHHAHYVPYDFSLPPFNLRKLCQLVPINHQDWTEFALFAL